MNDLSGGAGVPTPNIDSIGKNGVKFERSYAGHATCAPSRAAIMTGRFATRSGFEFTPAPAMLSKVISSFGSFNKSRLHYHDVFYNKKVEKAVPHFHDMIVPANETFISQILRQKSYRNYYFGKVNIE